MAWIRLLDDKDSALVKPIKCEPMEIFSLWDVKENKYIQEGQQVDTEMGAQAVSKYIRLSKEEKDTKYRRNNKFRYSFMINQDDKETEMFFDAPVKTKEQIEMVFETLKASDKDPTQMWFKLTRKGKKGDLKTTYALELTKEKPEPKKKPKLELDVPEEVDIEEPKTLNTSNFTELESEIIKGLSQEHYKGYSQEQRIKAFELNGVPKERAEQIVKEAFK